MKEYRIIYLDAFTSEPFSGNPCAVLPQAEGLTDAQMQKIAMETNLSETAFVFPSDKATVKVRYFMPRKEIPFAGHPTIATAMMLAQEGLLPHQRPVATVDFEFNIGVLPVDIHLDEDGKPIKAVMTQQKPAFGHILDKGDLTECLGIGVDDLLDNASIQVVSTGVPFYWCRLTHWTFWRKARVNRAPFHALLSQIGVDAAYLFHLGGFAPDADAHGRLFLLQPVRKIPLPGRRPAAWGLIWHATASVPVLLMRWNRGISWEGPAWEQSKFTAPAMPSNG